VSETTGTPFTRITRDEAAALWASNGEVWAMVNGHMRSVYQLRPDPQERPGLTWSIRVIEDGQAVFYVRSERGES